MPVWFVKWEEHALTNKLSDWLVFPCCTYCEVIQASAPWNFIPHTALGPCQIYSYPWRPLIRDLEHDFAASSNIGCLIFIPPLEKQQEAKVAISQVTHGETFRLIQCHAHFLDMCCWDHWAAMFCRIREWADSSGLWDTTLHYTNITAGSTL